MDLFLIAVSMLLASVLAGLGVLFLTAPQKAFEMSGHVERALPMVMGGRYFGLAALIIGLLILGNWQALALAFAIGAGFGFFDGIVVRRFDGSSLPHFGAGAVSAVLAICCVFRTAG